MGMGDIMQKSLDDQGAEPEMPNFHDEADSSKNCILSNKN